jgi:hypothetical protein
MTQALPSPSHALRRMIRVLTLATIATVSSHSLSAQATPPTTPTPTTPGFSVVQGYITDSIHAVPLVNATVLIEGTKRSAVSDKDGHYRVDSIPPGTHRIVVMHPLLDTIGIPMRTGEYPFGAGESHDLDMAVPGGDRLVKALCPPARIALGPAVMLGFVRDPDSNAPAVGSKVELVYQVSDPIGRKSNTVRSAVADSAGLYRICGIPADMSGKVQVFRNGVSSGEVPAEVNNLVALRAFSVSAHQVVAMVAGDSGKVKRVAKGTARVTGKVVDKLGKPLAGARIMLQSGGAVAISKANGDFVLDSLPAGTQAIEVRKLGYAAAEEPVELASNEAAKTTVTLGDFVPTLAVMRVEAKEDKALADLGYLDRKKTSGGGFFMDGKTVNHDAITFSDVMRVAPGLRVQPSGDGRTYVITDSRSSSNGCVNYYIDNTPWQTMTPGDIDDAVRPSEVVAVEVYHGGTTPPQFTPPGQSGCATIVIWTVGKVNTMTKKKSP